MLTPTITLRSCSWQTNGPPLSFWGKSEENDTSERKHQQNCFLQASAGATLTSHTPSPVLPPAQIRLSPASPLICEHMSLLTIGMVTAFRVSSYPVSEHRDVWGGVRRSQAALNHGWNRWVGERRHYFWFPPIRTWCSRCPQWCGSLLLGGEWWRHLRTRGRGCITYKKTIRVRGNRPDGANRLSHVHQESRALKALKQPASRYVCWSYLLNQFQHDQVGSFRAADEAGNVESRVERRFVQVA